MSMVIAEIEGVDYRLAKEKVLAWQRPLVERLVQPGLAGLADLEAKLKETDNPLVQAYRPAED